MRALAGFAMRGKREATGVAVVCASLPFLHWLSIAIISLVILRKGPAEGAFVLLWSCLPVAMLLYLTGDPGPAIAFLGSAALAWLLRVTVSWQLILSAIVVIAAWRAAPNPPFKSLKINKMWVIFFYLLRFSGKDYDNDIKHDTNMKPNFLSHQSVKFRSQSIRISTIYRQNKAKNALNLRNIGTPLNRTPNPLKSIEIAHFSSENAHFPYKITKCRGGTTGRFHNLI